MKDFFNKQEVVSIILLFILIGVCLVAGVISWALTPLEVNFIESFETIKPFLVLTMALSFAVICYMFTVRWILYLITFLSETALSKEKMKLLNEKIALSKKDSENTELFSVIDDVIKESGIDANLDN